MTKLFQPTQKQIKISNLYAYENYLNEDMEKLISNKIKENVDNSKFKCEKINH